MSKSEYKLINIADLVETFTKELVLRKQEPELPLKTLPMLSDKMWGLRKKKLTVIGARTSQGKSSIAMQICFDLAQQGKKVVFLSLEMENLECVERLVSHALEIHNRALLRGDVNKYIPAIQNFGKIFRTKNFIVSDCIGKDWQEINTLIESWHKVNTIPDVIVVDYIQNIKGVGATQKDIYDEYIRKFREMAIRYNFAGILCSQVNRTSQESKDKTPHLHQLKSTGFLEEHSDCVILLHWPYFYDQEKDKNHFEIYLAKNKLGETGFFNVQYLPEYFMFKEIKKEVVTEQPRWNDDN